MLSQIQHRLKLIAKRPLMAVLMTLVISMSNVGVEPSRAAINTSPVGAGFTVTAADLAFILKQIKIAEYHAANTTSTTGLCGAMVGPGPNQIPSTLLSFGLRTVDGSCNNLQLGQETYGSADQPFPRLTTPVFKQAEDATAFGGPLISSYAQTSGAVVDSQPRLASNLIVDQTSTNPAAIFVAGFPSRTQGNEGVVPCTVEPTTPGGTDGIPLGCVPAHETLFIPNVTTDVGLSPPFNSLFTIFGQFFDHGLDKITNGGAGTVFVPLKADDPLVAGPDHLFNTGDDLPSQLRFMIVTRGTIVQPTCSDSTNPNCYRSAPNTDTPFVDQSQTYTSHASHQLFMREYVLVAGTPVATGKFLSDADGGIANWAAVKAQAANRLGLQLADVDVNNIPLMATDQYGNYIPGPLRGLPQYVTTTGTGLVEGDLVNPVPVPANAIRIDRAFLNDIAHSAAPGSLSAPKPPDADTIAGGSLDTPFPAGSYDNELLDLHFICGDGRCNENIGLTAVHQVFHMEHDRLVDYFINPTNGVLTRPENLALWNDFRNVNLTPANPGDKTFTYGERLFQAARFVTEMEYQHLVFEEFARKVQPAINPFEPFAFNQTDLNSAITAEFAHAVYRFGHSMLTETLPRLNAPVSVSAGAPLHNDIKLLDGFLNPSAFYNGGNNVTLTSRQGTASLIMGLSDQVGNEIDEFVTDTLRNHLLGLPLDLPSINMARARSEGVPSLNNFRKQIWAATNDGQLAPYSHWVGFGEEIKHPVSLVNFIAAYGKHPTIVNAATLATKRIAADQIVNGTVLPGPDGVLVDDPLTLEDESADNIFPPEDSADFMFSTNAWANDVNGVSSTGVDDIDLWVGGLAEKTNLFGGLLGSTFNYVFEKQLTDLQNGDRFYYLARTPGMNLRTQLEGNSFSEMVMRNTNPYTHTLKADPFATADCKFESENLIFPALAGSFITGPGSIQDDPATECDENRLLLREPDGRIRYRAVNSVDPAGINGQSVYNGTDFADAFYGGNDNDTFWGGLGNDKIEGGGGDDVSLGGEGDDIITDFGGADILKGGPGNDALDGGIGDDIIMGGEGIDFTNGGANLNETFLGDGDDFAIAGQGTDAVFGDSGDDWEEGGDQPDLLIGDSSTLFFDDHNLPGHDILIGQGGDDDYDMEGGDDIGVAGPGVEKVAGASGWDWEIGLNDPQPQNSDLELLIVNVPPVNETRDRFNEIEALSGWKFNDTLRGDSIIPSQVGGGGFIGCDALDQAGLDRIAGLDALVPPLTVPTASVVALSVTNYCLLTGPFVWGEGNILLGGAGSDTLEGRGGDDILDGDKYMNVRLSVRDSAGSEIGSTSLMETAAVTGNFGPGTGGMTLQQAVFRGLVNPGNIKAVREILPLSVSAASDCGVTNPVNCDVAVFSGPVEEYTITPNANGSVTVADNSVTVPPAVPRNDDGTDTLWNIEQLSFCPSPGAIRGTCDSAHSVVKLAPSAVVSGSLAFGNRAINTTSVRTLTISNTGIGNLVVSGVSITGPDAASFQMGINTCISPLVQGGVPCTINVRFIPTTAGLKTANVLISHNADGSPTSIPVSGTGTIPIASVSPSAINFGTRNLNTALTRTVTLTNTGNVNLAISNISVTGVGFSRVGAGCGASLGAGLSCGITVRFLPTSTGVHNGLLTITDNSNNTAGSVQTVTLTGTGVVQLPIASLSPTSLDFGNVLVNNTFQQSVTLTNTGTGVNAMSIASIAITGAGFSRVGGLPGNCSTSLASGASCEITVRFRPTTGGDKTGTLTVTDNSGNIIGSTQAVSLAGSATISANDDTLIVLANGVLTPQIINFGVRANDQPANLGVVTIVSSSFTNGGATATVVINSTNQVSWTLTPTGTTAAARQASKRGTYTVNYLLTSGTATSTATYTLSVN